MENLKFEDKQLNITPRPRIDLRRMPQDQAPNVEKKEMRLEWLYEPDFKKDVANWVQAHAAHT